MDNRLSELPRSYVVIDIESTGLSVSDDSIIELSAIRVEDGTMTASFSSLINPCRHIPIDATLTNRITDDMVSKYPTIDVVMPKFLEFIGDFPVLGHNIEKFDLPFINRVCRDLGLPGLVSNSYLDSLVVARAKLPCLSSRSLQTLSALYGVDYKGAHRALIDCSINFHVMNRLSKQNPVLDVGTCPECGSKLKIRLSKYGTFLGCSNYPKCSHTAEYKMP